MSRKSQVYDYLLEAIISNKIPSGNPIVESTIAKELNVSRTPIREALLELEAEGLVSRYPSIGTVVSHISPYDVEEIFDLRILLELHALKTSLSKITLEELERLEEKFHTYDLKSSKEAYHLVDQELHSTIVNKAGNMRLKRFLDMLNSQIERFRRLAALSETRVAKSKKEHLEIIYHLKNRDLMSSKSSLKNHLSGVKNSTLEVARTINLTSDD